MVYEVIKMLGVQSGFDIFLKLLPTSYMFIGQTEVSCEQSYTEIRARAGPRGESDENYQR